MGDLNRKISMGRPKECFNVYEYEYRTRDTFPGDCAAISLVILATVR